MHTNFAEEALETSTIYSDAKSNTSQMHKCIDEDDHSAISDKKEIASTYPTITTLHLSQLGKSEEYETRMERRNIGTEDDTVVIDIRDIVRLKQYSVTITQKDVEQMQTVPTKTISFLHTVLFDAFHNDNGNEEAHPTVPLTYGVREPTHPPEDYFVFSIHNTYKYAPFSFDIKVPQQTLSEAESIKRRLDKVLTENESLQRQLQQSKQWSCSISEQMDTLRAEVHYVRNVERYRHGFTLGALNDALEPLFAVCNPHWTTTRSFGGLDVACPSHSTQQKGVNPTILQYKSLCANATPTYRSIAQRIVDLYEEHNGVPIKSYHLPFLNHINNSHKNYSCSARIVHHLTKERATRVRVRLVVPEHKGMVASVCGVKITDNGSLRCLGSGSEVGIMQSGANRFMLRGGSTQTSIFPSNITNCYEGSSATSTEECREWIMFWNKVDQWWELEEKYVSTTNRPIHIKFRTAMELRPEWRAQGVHHEYDVLEWETEE